MTTIMEQETVAIENAPDVAEMVATETATPTPARGGARGSIRGRSARGGNRPRAPRERGEFDQVTIDARRVARVMAGGRRFNFSVAMVAGNAGMAKCGKGGCIALAYWDEKAKRMRAVCGDEGDGIKADTWYRVKGGILVEVK